MPARLGTGSWRADLSMLLSRASSSCEVTDSISWVALDANFSHPRMQAARLALAELAPATVAQTRLWQPSQRRWRLWVANSVRAPEGNRVRLSGGLHAADSQASPLGAAARLRRRSRLVA